MHPADKTIRFANFMTLTDQGVDNRGASVAAFALHPMDSDQQPVNRRLEKALRKRSRKLAKSIKKADAALVLGLATDALRDYKSLATQNGDPYYVLSYTGQLDAAVDDAAWEADTEDVRN